MKPCNRCGVVKPLDSFSRNKRCKDGRLGICKVCAAAVRAAYLAKPENRERVAVRMRDYHFANRPKLLKQQGAYRAKHRTRLLAKQRQRITGFSPTLYLAALEAQDHRCPICRCDLDALDRKHRHADHCHASGSPRGILCKKCNTALGQFKDDPALLERAAAYLRSPPLKGFV